jgi:hypothetical protein
MVNAILDGRKAVTRRLVAGERQPEPLHAWQDCDCREIDPSDTPCVVCLARFERCPAFPGDRLWVREAFRLRDFDADGGTVTAEVVYRAGGDPGRIIGGEALLREYVGWRPSIYMPRWASRLLLEVEDVRAERLRDITEDDARCEGVDPDALHIGPDFYAGFGGPYRAGFAVLWDRINGKRAVWSEDPWVWRIQFRVVGRGVGCAVVSGGEP